MTTNRIRQTVRMWVLSTLLALAAFSFLAVGVASAHTVNHATNAAQTVSSSTTVVSRIIETQQGRVFSPSTVTVASGTIVKIVNKTTFSLILFTSAGIVRLGPGANLKITATQSQGVGICGGGSLSITVA